MLAGLEKALSAQVEGEAKEEMRAIKTLLEGLIDYAGLYPPAGLGMHFAVRNYLNHRQGKFGYALGRFVVDLDRIGELRAVAGASIGELRLSVVVSPATDWAGLAELIEEGRQIESIEIKPAQAEDAGWLTKHAPSGVTTYIEVPVDRMALDLLDSFTGTGGRAKLRMGGVVAEAFPAASDAARMLKELADCRISFKATAGLHHPIRSRHPLTYKHDSPTGMMHGFINLFCAATLVYFGGDASGAERLLQEEDVASWEVSGDAIAWGSLRWNVAQMREVRLRFMNSFGSCSFEEPLRDLEALGWL
jgi:hypothetical protein